MKSDIVFKLLLIKGLEVIISLLINKYDRKQELMVSKFFSETDKFIKEV